MSFLDDLKNDAEQARKAKAAREAEEARLQSIYQDNICPRMMAIAQYLLDLAEQLETVEWQVQTEFRFPGLGLVEDLHQREYKVHVDSSDAPTLIDFSFLNESSQEDKYALEQEEADQLQKFLLSQQVRSVTWPKREPGKQLIICETRLAAKTILNFKANVEDSCIDLSIYNHLNDDVQQMKIAHSANIDNDWLDNLGGFVLRKTDTLIKKRTMNDTERLELQQHLVDAKIQELHEEKRAAEAVRAEEEAEAAAAAERRNKAMQRVLNKIPPSLQKSLEKQATKLKRWFK